MLNSSKGGLMLNKDEQKATVTATVTSQQQTKMMPINPPQNWTSALNLESNGVSVILVPNSSGSSNQSSSSTSTNNNNNNNISISNGGVSITPANSMRPTILGVGGTSNSNSNISPAPSLLSSSFTITPAAVANHTQQHQHHQHQNQPNKSPATAAAPTNPSKSSTNLQITKKKELKMSPERKPVSDGNGLAKCENCGSYGVKQAFYTKKRNFCSVQCIKDASKKYESEIEQLKNEMARDDSDGGGESSGGSSIERLKRNSRSRSSSESDDSQSQPKKRIKYEYDPSNFDWTPKLNKTDFNAASVSHFKHAPVAYLWDNVTVGMKVEVENTDVEKIYNQTAFWVASVTKIQGYKVRLRFEGFSTDGSRDFWVNLCSEDVHHVGWCATKNKPLIPPRAISNKFTDWRDFLVKRLTGARTLPQNFQAKVTSGLKSKYELNSELEVVDKNRISQLRLASVKKIVGKRLQIKYFNSEEDGGFWCHEDSPLIHPRGWARSVGHELLAPKSYQPDLLPKTIFNDDSARLDIKEGMKLEAIDPLNLSAICAATIKKVLNYGYIMVRVDCYEEEESNLGLDWFCYHVTSPYVFPCGFAERNGIKLTPPVNYDKNTFKWNHYLDFTNSKPAPIIRLPSYENQAHGFQVGMKVEAADLMDPRLICVATIGYTVGRLLKIHFDGWEEEYDQWLDAFSPDVYPVGWCELVGHRLEPPRPPAQPLTSTKKAKGKPKKKIQIKGKTQKVDSGLIKIKKVKKIPQLGAGGSAKINQVNKQHNIKSSINSQPTTITTVQRKQSMIVPGQANNNNKNGSLHNQQIKSDNNAKTERQDFRVSNATASTPAPATLPTSFSSSPKPTMSNQQTTSSNSPVRELKMIPKSIFTTSDVGNLIPRLIDISNNADLSEVDPNLWSIDEVSLFLSTNDSEPYAERFVINKIDGKTLVKLNKDQLVVLTGMKVGPALKILDLISNLNRLINSSKAKKTASTKF